MVLTKTLNNHRAIIDIFSMVLVLQGIDPRDTRGHRDVFWNGGLNGLPPGSLTLKLDLTQEGHLTLTCVAYDRLPGYYHGDDLQGESTGPGVPWRVALPRIP